MQITQLSFWRPRLRASAIHLCFSLAIATLAAALVFGLWYPYPYREISGGRELFTILVSVDVLLGPLITLAVFNRAKPWPELRRDLCIVVLLQLAALGYGLWSVGVARPVHLVFEYDRFRVVHAVDVPAQLLDKAPKDIVALPWSGPTLLSLRPLHDNQERTKVTMEALAGLELGTRPDLWQSYAAGVPDILRAAHPLSALMARFATQAARIQEAVAATGRSADGVVYLPLVGRKAFWTVLLDAHSGEVLGTLPLDSF